MKVDRSRLKKSTSEVPPECQVLIDRLKHCNQSQLLHHLANIETWTFGKCELYHWIDVLDIFDEILEKACRTVGGNRWALACDILYTHEEQKLVLWTLHFTTLLIEHSFSRHLYNSMEHLNALLASSDMQIVMGVLNLLYMFSKRSNFITRLSSDKRQILLPRLHYLAESWGGKENGFGLADCCNNEKPIPVSATTLHFEFYCDTDAYAKNGKHPINCIHLENIDKMLQSPAEIMRGLVQMYNIPPEKTFLLFTHVRLAYQFSDYKSRLLCVQARLQALSVLVYSNALQDNAHTLLYPGLLEELVELLELQMPYLVEIRSAALRTLTSIIHLDRNPHFPKRPGSRLIMIIDVTGASLYHGFLPVLVRTCIATLTQPRQEGVCNELFPLPLATALFSFLYHLASYEAGGDALVNCGMMESLLHVINWHGNELEHITFVTRAVRVIDLITNIDMQSFQAHGGLQSFINRLNVEVNICKEEQFFDLNALIDKDLKAVEDRAAASSSQSSSDDNYFDDSSEYTVSNGKTCLPQRAALLKSMLNFLKKALQDPTFSDCIRHVMEGTLPSSLKHIIGNAEYYGPSLFLLATDVVTVYVFQEPSLLSSLQDNGLTDVVLHSLLIKDVPATREVLGSLPNVFSALCLNTRGLVSFVTRQPFNRLFKVLLSPMYLPAMRRRRTSDPLGDTATNLGNAMDELMRHQPSLKVDATAAIIKLLQELCHLGTDPKYVCHRATQHNKSELSLTPVSKLTGANEGSSDEDDEDEEEASTSSHTQRDENGQESTNVQTSEKTPVVLVDYILNVMKFVDAILSNNSTDDHCREFVNQGGLVPLLKILGLPNLPVDCPVTQAAQAVASVCKSIINLAHEPKVLKQGLTQLADVLRTLEPLCTNLEKPGGSILLHELANAPNIETAFSSASATPLLHAMNAAHGYVLMFVHVCRTGQNDIRSLSLQHWGSDDGLNVLSVLAELYTSLVWESTLLLALCSDDIIPANCDFGKEDMDKLLLLEKIAESADSNITQANVCNDSSNGMTSAMEALRASTPMGMDVDNEVPSTSKHKDERTPPTSHQLKYIKPLLGASSRLGRALAELFGLLVKLCVGSPIRQRRGQSIVSQPHFPGPFARSVATALNYLLASGLNWEKLPVSPIPKFRLTFLICSVGFTSPMLFDEKRYPYHLMLQRFVSLGGQATFFNTFRWALSAGGRIPIEQGLEHPELPDGTGEFLDAWLMLLEKMVNPKAILDSPHVISKQGTVRGMYRNCTFDPVKYLVQIHKHAFEAVMLMWSKKPLSNYGGRMSESMLSILRHILRGEKIVKERLNKTDDITDTVNQPDGEQSSSNTGASSNNIQILPHMPDVNYDHMYQLLDMGFPLEQCREALLHTTSVEQATDYLLNNPQPRDQATQNISMNLSPPGDGKSIKRLKEDDCVPLSEEAINDFTKDALQTCLQLLDVLPDTVYRVCDLLVTITKRNGEVYRQKMLDILLSEIGNYMLQVLSSLDKKENINMVDEWLNGKAATKMAVRLHLYTLLFEGPVIHEMRIPCAQAVHRSNLLPFLIKLLIFCERIMRTATEQSIQFTTPKWLTPLILLLDLIEKVALCTQRKEEMHKCTTRIWRWYDLTTGKWTPYSSANNKLINDAYWNSEGSMRVTCGRRRYTISFNSMGQTNDETANNRPIGMAIHNTYKNKEDSDGDEMDIDGENLAIAEKEHKRNVPVQGLTEDSCTRIVRTCVKLMELEVDRDTLHAVMRLCLRLTRDFRCARIFAEQGGVRMLLNMTQASSFSGFTTLATLLIRHVLEEPQTLCLAMEKVLRGRTLNTIPPQHKELQYLCRHISSVVCRNPDAFIEVGKSILRVDISELNRRGDEEDTRLILRCEPPTRSPAQPMDESVSITVIYDLLNALIKPINHFEPSTTSNSGSNSGSNSASSVSNQEPFSIASSQSSSSSSSTSLTSGPQTSTARPIPRIRGSELTENSDDLGLIDKPKDVTSTPATKVPHDEDSKKPLLPKHALLKMLAEAVRSYGAVAKLITEFTYKAGQSELIIEDCTAIAFLLDNLLPVNENFHDPECSMMARMLIAAIASCNHSPDAQASLVSELKSALGRALAMPESQEKHMQIQLLAGLVSTMIEHCPPSQHTSVRGLKLHSIGHNPNVLNNIVKIMLRKGFLADLARIPHCLDLSSPIMAMTVNSALKPLETLSRIVNQPSNGIPPKYLSPKKNVGEERVNPSGVTSTEVTNAQGEEAAEDTENTEHDISGATESLEPHSDGHPQEVGDVDRLEDIMEILDRENQSNNRSYNDVASGRNHHAMDIDEDNEIRNIVYETDRDVTEELMSTDSGESVSNPSDNEVEDDTNDDEDVEDDEMDEGDENDDNNYDEDEEYNGLGFFDNENPGLFRITPNAEREEEVLMIQYSDPDSESDSMSRMVHWNTNGMQFPFGMFEEGNSNNDNAAPSSHPLLMSRNNLDGTPMSVSRTQRTNRQRRYQYLQINARNQNPPVILQRLLGPGGQNIPMGGPVMTEPPIRVTNRVVLMENGFNLFPTAEEQIDFVDQSGYLFGPSLAATLNNIPSALHWWNEEKALLDGESHADVCVAVCSKLIPFMEQHRDAELSEKKRKRQEEMEDFGYDGIRFKTPQETMETDKTVAGQNETKADNLTVENDTADNTQLLAETVVESVLRPNNIQGRETTRRLSQEDSSTAGSANVPTRQPQPVTLIQNGEVWEYSESPMVDMVTDTTQNLEQSSRVPETCHIVFGNYSSSESRHITEYNVLEPNLNSLPPTPDGGPLFSQENRYSPHPPQEMGEESIASQDSTMTGEYVRDTPVPYTQSSDDYDVGCGYIVSDTSAEILNLQSMLSDNMSNPVVRLRNMAATSLSGENVNRSNVTVTVPESSLNMEFNITSPYTSSFSQSTGADADNEADDNDVANDSFRSEDSEIIEIFNNTQPPDTSQDNQRPRPTNEQTLSETQTNRNEDVTSPELFSSEEDCNMDEDDKETQSNQISMGENESADEPHPVIEIDSTEDNTQPMSMSSRESTNIIIELDNTSEDALDSQASTVLLNLSQERASSSNFYEDLLVQTDRVITTEEEILAIDASQSNSVEYNSQSVQELANYENEEESSEVQVNVDIEEEETEVISQSQTSQGTESTVSSNDVPPGVDPSFLEALPEEVRLEVIAEQNRLARMRAQAQANTSTANDSVGSIEVNPEFLAALPPALQEEVLAQQRLEQQRQAAAAANPDDPVDTVAFFQNLQPSLRQAILTDIDETQMSALPPDLAAEAQNLRRDWEARNRQLMQERFLNQLQSNTALSSILRQSGRARLGGARYTIHTVPHRWNTWTRDGNKSTSPITGNNLRMRGRQLLDHESLSCLLVLLFADEPKLNTLRLHRVIRNLCYHSPTRDWIVKALLSIIERSVNIKIDIESSNPKSSKRVMRPGPLCAKLQTDPRSVNNNAAWLNIKMDAALGCRANVFIVHRNQSGKKNDRQSMSSVTIHPQAAPIVCRHALDLFISLAKSFPSFFLPLKAVREEESKDKDVEVKKVSSSPTKNKFESTDFWDMLLKLDSLSATKKGKSVAKIHNSSSINTENENTSTTFESSTFGQLMSMLSSPVIKRSSQLTDKLLKLLSLITVGLPDLPNYLLSGKLNTKSKSNRMYSCYSAFEDSIKLVITAITNKNCSEEGLEDAATLLFNIANCTEEMRYLVLWQMLNGMLKLASEITLQIKDLLTELKSTNQLQKSTYTSEEGPSSERPAKGLMNNRFTQEPVVITALNKVKQSCDLQLPAMAPLTNKISSQAFFLRLLRLVAQIHENIRKSSKEIPVDINIDKPKPDEYDADEECADMETNSLTKNSSTLDLDTDVEKEIPILSEMMHLGKLWQMLSECLLELEHTPDHHAVLVLQPTVEAFFLVHSPQKTPNEMNEEREEAASVTESTSQESTSNTDATGIDSFSQVPQNKVPKEIPADQQKFLQFAEKHRTVLNQILRQTNAHLADGPFSVLVDHTRILDFDVKRKYFRTELERLDSGIRREETAVHVRRSHVFEDSFRELYRRTPEEWKNRFYIVFEEEEGQDAGGLLREWYMIISRDIFNPMYALFTVSPGDRVTYMINSSSHCNPNHLCYYKFVGRVIAKAIYDNKLLECYFTRSFYKHILGIAIKYTDMESEDYSFYSGLRFLIHNKVVDLGYELTFSQEMNEFGTTNIRELLPNGRNIIVTDENKMEYVRLLCQMKMTDAIKQQLKAFLEGFYDIIPKRLISIFNEQELELLISGLPNVDIEDLKANTEYHKYQSNSLQIQWFWRALRSFDQADRAKFLQFVTGTSKVPLQGFSALEGMNGTQKFQIHRDDRSTDRLPSAHTCFNQLDLPVYETYDKLRSYLLKAIHECSEGFGFA